MGILRIISGGQTGVDQGALEFALNNHIPCGGFCPKGRKCETGKIAPHFPMTETESGKYSVRTRMNIDHSDGTLIIAKGNTLGKGTALTIDLCNFLGKPFIILDLNEELCQLQKEFSSWIELHRIRILNVAGNRESQSPGIKDLTILLLQDLILNSRG